MTTFFPRCSESFQGLSLLKAFSSKSGATSPTLSVDVLSAVELRPLVTAMPPRSASRSPYPAVAAVCWSATILALERFGPLSSMPAFRRAATGLETAIYRGHSGPFGSLQ